MPRITWSAPASLDLIRLHEFLAPKSRTAALRAVKTIKRGVKILAAHPEIGRPVEGMLPPFRDLIIGFGRGG
jgi:plasmid stabilization system protein ParE